MVILYQRALQTFPDAASALWLPGALPSTRDAADSGARPLACRELGARRRKPTWEQHRSQSITSRKRGCKDVQTVRGSGLTGGGQEGRLDQVTLSA